MPDDLDPVWKALSDPTRRAILDLVRQGPRRTTEIVDAFPHLSRFGVMKHIEVLRDAGLINTREAGRQRVNSLNAVPIRQIYERWVSRYEGFWADKLLRLQEDVEAGRAPKREPQDQPEDGGETLTETRRETMNDQNFTATFTVDQTPEEAFAAINNVRGWWSGEIEGGTDKLGDEFTYRYKDVHYSKQKITQLIPGKKVVWLVLDGYLGFVEDKTEWKDTQITFEVSKNGDNTEVRFTHVGLVPEYECFNACSNAWGFYINRSLRSLIATGKGEPNKKEKGG